MTSLKLALMPIFEASYPYVLSRASEGDEALDLFATLMNAILERRIITHL
jgi:hypothetical protein